MHDERLVTLNPQMAISDQYSYMHSYSLFSTIFNIFIVVASRLDVCKISPFLAGDYDNKILTPG